MTAGFGISTRGNRAITTCLFVTGTGFTASKGGATRGVQCARIFRSSPVYRTAVNSTTTTRTWTSTLAPTETGRGPERVSKGSNIIA